MNRRNLTEEQAAAMIESLDRHFLTGCRALSTTQLDEHEATGTCPECRRRAGQAAEAAEAEVTR